MKQTKMYVMAHTVCSLCKKIFQYQLQSLKSTLMHNIKISEMLKCLFTFNVVKLNSAIQTC